MHFSMAGLMALVALAAASPMPNHIEARAVCTPQPTTTTVISGATTTLSGPFKLTASATNTAVARFNGGYAKFNANTFQNVVFGTVAAAGNLFWLDNSGHLIGNNTNVGLLPALQYLYKGTVPHVAVERNGANNPLPICSIDSTSCALNCNVNGATTNYLASVSDQPDWAIAFNKSTCGIGCYPFQPYVVPAKKSL